MTLNWTLLLDADLSLTDWQYSIATSANLIRIDQENPPDLGRFALAQVSNDQNEFLEIKSYPAATESVRVTPSYQGEGDRLFAIKHRYSEFPEGTPNTWRVKVYGSTADLSPPINPTAVVITLDPRVAGAIPLEEKGIPLGIADLDAAGKIPAAYLPPGPSIESLGGEPAGTASQAIIDHKAESEPHPQYVVEAELDSHITSTNNPHLVTLAQVGGEPSGAETRANQYTDQQINAIPLPTPADIGAASLGLDGLVIPTQLPAIPSETTIQNLTNRLTALEATFPTNHTHIWGYGRAYNGNATKTFNYVYSNAYELSRYAVFNSPAFMDTVEFDAILKAGNYDITFIHDKSSDRGIFTLYVDNKPISSTDCYASSYTVRTLTKISFTLSSSGSHNFKVVINDKNASSTGYYFACTAAFIRLTNYVTIPNTIRINCGNTVNYTDSQGNNWIKDTYAVGGGTRNTEASVGAYTAANTVEQALFKYERYGNFYYDIPIVSPGTFTINLLFIDAFSSSVGENIIQVQLQQQPLLTNFDIFAQVGAKAALIKTFTNRVISTNSIRIDLSNGDLSGIEIIRTG